MSFTQHDESHKLALFEFQTCPLTSIFYDITALDVVVTAILDSSLTLTQPTHVFPSLECV